jgi:hypothetical protein
MRNQLLVFVSLLLCSIAWGQSQTSSSAPSSGQQSMPGMDMSGHDMSAMKDMNEDKGSPDVMHSMEGHMDMGPHMKMTELRAAKPGDAERAEKVVAEARTAAEKYTDYHVALADGFHIFLPNVPQKVYHFTSRSYAIEAQFHFNPEHPTSLLYERHGDDYKLVGVMYTAPKSYTEDQLDARIPLSIAQWHEHVNFCRAPLGKFGESFGPHAKFGALGSISTKEACDAEGGTFLPVVFNWMVHVYPFERDQASIWSVERQHGDAD